MAAQIIAFSNVNHRTLMELPKADFATATLITQVVPNPLSNAAKLQNDHLILRTKYLAEPSSHLTLEGFLATNGFVNLLEHAGREVTQASITASAAGNRPDCPNGIALPFDAKNDPGSRLADIAYLRKSGKLVQ